MREILFRGKRIDNDEWVYGSFCMDALEQFNGLCGVDGFIRLYDKTKCKMQTHEVDRETVGQYTGLTDKNGKRIFEGDIVQYHERQFDGKDVPVRDAVIYEEGGFSVRAYFLNNWLWNSINGNTQLRDVEIIGNIHDKPELLKEGADNAK